MLDELRRGSMEDPNDDDKPKKKPKTPGFFSTLSPFERTILAVLTLLVVIVFVVLILLATGRIQL
jgi:hypothetical protein